ncbi:Coenzyme F420 hydrogenase/dehydrogenase, beta subunit C-terminal domain [Dyadobacter sp.]|uniref:Coenzyme F420 hydrogenase/dehydrogenase, beta subunit C-terminal domain n=1 Tax=Dyadobacter sp. TaxID=1914288 RepID=UPI003F6F297A
MENTILNSNPIRKVVEGGYCVGCGACAFVQKKNMIVNEFGEYVPEESVMSNELDFDNFKKLEFVCPSLNPEHNENVLASTFLDKTQKFSDHIGYYQSVYGGYVRERDFRDSGTSGGFGTWVGAELLKQGHIDGVIHVKEQHRASPLAPFFKYGISESLAEIQSGSRTKYHVVEVSEILKLIKSKPGRYLFMGLPCMVKAIRRVQLIDEDVANSIKYTVALVCGHLKSINWTLSLAWGKGAAPTKLQRFQYRTKEDGISARAYVFKAFIKNNEQTSEILADSGEVTGGKFNQGALMLPACNFCDDLVGETADLTIGDAWLPRYEIDPNGTNLLIVRNATIERLLSTALAENRIHLDNLFEKDAIYAQSGGFRQRREGLSHRLKLVDNAGYWRPVKRITATQFAPPPLRKMIYNMRSKVTADSRLVFRDALKTNNYELYRAAMNRQLKTLRFLEISSSAVRIVSKKLASYKIKLLKR